MLFFRIFLSLFYFLLGLLIFINSNSLQDYFIDRWNAILIEVIPQMPRGFITFLESDLKGILPDYISIISCILCWLTSLICILNIRLLIIFSSYATLIFFGFFHLPFVTSDFRILKYSNLRVLYILISHFFVLLIIGGNKEKPSKNENITYKTSNNISDNSIKASPYSDKELIPLINSKMSEDNHLNSSKTIPREDKQEVAKKESEMEKIL